MRRNKMSRRGSRKNFRRNSATHSKNFGMPMRGGYRL